MKTGKLSNLSSTDPSACSCSNGRIRRKDIVSCRNFDDQMRKSLGTETPPNVKHYDDDKIDDRAHDDEERADLKTRSRVVVKAHGERARVSSLTAWGGRGRSTPLARCASSTLSKAGRGWSCCAHCVLASVVVDKDDGQRNVLCEV